MEQKRADLYKVGEEFEPLVFRVTPEWNAQFREALEADYDRYKDAKEGEQYVVPGLLIGNSNVTRSPGFQLDPGMAAVHAKEDLEYCNHALVGSELTVKWRVVDTFEKRGRPFQVKEALIVDQDGTKILKRTITDTYLGGPYKGGKEEDS